VIFGDVRQLHFSIEFLCAPIIQIRLCSSTTITAATTSAEGKCMHSPT